MIYTFYRISDKSYEKVKLFGATKQLCFSSFMKAFPDQQLLILADNCSKETIGWLEDFRAKTPTACLVETSLGNAGSARQAIIESCERIKDPQAIVYFAEDDYLYKPETDCSALLKEGLSRSHYVTLYDHPDKYQEEYGFGEITKVFKTKSSHWRYTISTTMTFASRIGTIKENMDTWMKFTMGTHPWDHGAFVELANKHKSLAVCIPGASCHIDLTYSAMKRQALIENWAIAMMEQSLYNEMNEESKEIYKKIANVDTSLQKLAMMTTISTHHNIVCASGDK